MTGVKRLVSVRERLLKVPLIGTIGESEDDVWWIFAGFHAREGAVSPIIGSCKYTRVQSLHKEYMALRV